MPHATRVTTLVTALTFASFLSACGGGTVAAPSCAGISELPAIPTMQLVYPVPGSTVADNPGNIIVSFSSPMSGWNMTLQSPSGSLDLGPLGPPPGNFFVPGSPNFPNPTYYGVTVSMLNAATTYTIILNQTTLPCVPSSTLGSFTTQ